MSDSPADPVIPEEACPEPMARAADIIARASQSPPFDPTAMTLSTCTPDGAPSSRVVLLKRQDESGFYFFTNYGSRKARELEQNPRAALCLYWPWLDEQIRVEGTVTRTSPDESDAYFKSRHRVSQLGAWASRQSEPLEDKALLTERLKTVETKYEDRLVPRPPFWGGFHLTPLRIEFWKNGEFRLHDRIVYMRESISSPWKTELLYP